MLACTPSCIPWLHDCMHRFATRSKTPRGQPTRALSRQRAEQEKLRAQHFHVQSMCSNNTAHMQVSVHTAKPACSACHWHIPTLHKQPAVANQQHRVRVQAIATCWQRLELCIAVHRWLPSSLNARVCAEQPWGEATPWAGLPVGRALLKGRVASRLGSGPQATEPRPPSDKGTKRAGLLNQEEGCHLQADAGC